MYEKHGAFYLVNKDNTWLRLGATLPEAMLKYAGLIVQRERITTIGQIIDRYQLEILPGKARWER